eukprot:jgi/Antlo1/1562/1678
MFYMAFYNVSFSISSSSIFPIMSTCDSSILLQHILLSPRSSRASHSLLFLFTASTYGSHALDISFPHVKQRMGIIM